jgi:chorismate mutase/prephenate dehydratase
MNETEQKLQGYRSQIDAVDARILELLNERARLALQVGIAKGGENIHRPEREAEVLRQLARVNNGPLANEAVQQIFENIIAVCRTIQYNK